MEEPHGTQAKGTEPPAPLLLEPQPQAVPRLGLGAAALAICAVAGGFFFSFGAMSTTDTATKNPVPDAAIFALPADQAQGAFTILPSGFQNSPASVLAQLDMPEAEKLRLEEELRDGGTRLAAVTLWDTVDEDGDVVDVSAAGFSQRLTILHKPKMFFLPVQYGGSVRITGVRDGGGGITLGVSTITGPVPLPPLAVSQSVEIPVL
jgi:hypothetical protein